MPDTISGSCGRACRLSSSARMLTTKPRIGRCFYTNFRTRPGNSCFAYIYSDDQFSAHDGDQGAGMGS